MDLSDTIAPTSDQLDAVDLLSGPRVFTIERVVKGSDEQPVNIHLAEFPRVWRPGKSMRRVLVRCWGPDAAKYTGRRVKLYCDPDVRFGGQAVGGTRIAALSHIDKPVQVPLLVSRGKSAIFVVQPLADAVPAVAILDPQSKLGHEMFACLNEIGAADRDTRLAYCADVIGRDIGTSGDMTEDEARAVIAAARKERADQQQPPDPSDPDDPWHGTRTAP